MKRLVLLVLVPVALVAAGCGSGSGGQAQHATASTPVKPAATQKPRAASAAPAKCTTPSSTLLTKIKRNVVLQDARLNHVAEVASPAFQDTFVVSATVSGGGASPGMVASWLARGGDGHAGLYALDANAALISQLGAANSADPELVVSIPGAYRSRVCSGGPNASPGENAPSSGGGANSAG